MVQEMSLYNCCVLLTFAGFCQEGEDKNGNSKDVWWWMQVFRENSKLYLPDKERIRSKDEGKHSLWGNQLSLRLFPSQVEGLFYVNPQLEKLMFDELQHHCASGGVCQLCLK